MNRRRLEFEAVRDSILAVAGTLDATVGGKPVNLIKRPYSLRRTIYGLVDRQDLPDMFQVFDFASPDVSTEQRDADDGSATSIVCHELSVCFGASAETRGPSVGRFAAAASASLVPPGAGARSGSGRDRFWREVHRQPAAGRRWAGGQNTAATEGRRGYARQTRQARQRQTANAPGPAASAFALGHVRPGIVADQRVHVRGLRNRVAGSASPTFLQERRPGGQCPPYGSGESNPMSEQHADGCGCGPSLPPRMLSRCEALMRCGVGFGMLWPDRSIGRRGATGARLQPPLVPPIKTR